MRPQMIIGLLLALGVAAFLFMTLNKEAPAPSQGPTAAAPEVKGTDIFMAAQAIPVGTQITAEMLTTQKWQDNLLLPGFVKAEEGAQAIVGEVARSPFQAQEPILKTKLANKNDPNFLAAELPKGMRVVTITTNETEGVAGFLFPGDHVDVMLTHDIDHGGVKDSVSETLLNNVKVLGVDQRAAGSKADADGKLSIPRSVSLMVSPTDAQRLRLGEKIGTLTLSLRALEDRESSDPMTIVRAHDISQSGGGVPAAAGAPVVMDDAGGVKIYRGVTAASDSPVSAGGAAAPQGYPAAPAAAATPAAPAPSLY